MPETIVGDIYDYPKYYDIVYGSDWRAEFDFLEDIFEGDEFRAQLLHLLPQRRIRVPDEEPRAVQEFAVFVTADVKDRPVRWHDPPEGVPGLSDVAVGEPCDT